MKKLLTVLAILWSSSAFAQTYPNHTAIIGAGPGVKSFKTAGPCGLNQALIWAGGVSADPTCGQPAVGSLIIGSTNITGGTLNNVLYVGAGLTLQQEAQIPPSQGGTGVNNGTNTLTLAAPLATFGTGSTSLIFGSSTVSYTFPALSDALAGLAQGQTFSGANIFSGSFNCTGTCQLGGVAFGTFATQNFATPPAIGGTTPNSGAFTTLTLTSPLVQGYGGTGASTVPGARVSLNIDQITRTGDANFTILASTRAYAHTALTAPRTDTLPLAASVNPGQTVIVVDAYGVSTVSNTVVLKSSGSDTINGGATSTAINSQYGGVVAISDGISNWSFPAISSGGGSGTVTTINCAKGTVCSSITTSGTVTAPAAVLAISTLAGGL